MMNAQDKWKKRYEMWKYARSNRAHADDRMYMNLIRREAALERKLAAAQRTIEAQEKQISRACALADVDNVNALGDWIVAAQSEIASLGGQLRDIWELQGQQNNWVIEDNPPPDLQKWYEQ